jgi:hypothetical protein
MMAALLIFFLLTYGLACLVADAKLFGCPAKSFYADPTDVQYIRENSVLPIRQAVLRLFPGTWFSRWIKLLLTCYLCLGVWCGAAVHLALVGLDRLDPTVPLLSSYPLLSSTALGNLVGMVLSAVAGGVACYVLDLLVQALENKVAQQTLVIEAAEEVKRLNAAEKLDVVSVDPGVR